MKQAWQVSRFWLIDAARVEVDSAKSSIWRARHWARRGNIAAARRNGLYAVEGLENALALLSEARDR